MQTNIAPENKEYFRLIKEALDERRLAFFVGAGVSRASNPHYPSWVKITETLKDGLAGNDETDPLKIAQLYALKYGNLKLKETVQSCFPTNGISSDIQQAILDLNPHYIISTNWDTLFENILNERISYIYDTVVCDSELIESKNDCKIIKMHGDFSHNNYVLTEDDYLNYSRNFPLIENYVKSIISTHTIVMLGYSFSDIDLKQIVNWFQNNSSVQPPIYMLVHKKDEYLKRYLQKYGIITIAFENGNQDSFLKDFLRILSHLDDFSHNPVEFVYNKIKKYEDYYTVLQENIRRSLGNCEIFYNSKKNGILHFFDSESINDKDNTQRDIYNQFIGGLDFNNEVTRKILRILSKANIIGIITSRNENGSYQYKSFADICDYNESQLLNFDFSPKKSTDFLYNLLESIICLAELGQTQEAFEKNKELISYCEKTRNYIYLFIGFFNHDQLLYQLRFSPKKTRDLVQSEQAHPIENLYTTLPKTIQRDYIDLYHFLTLRDLYKMHFDISKDVETKEEHVDIIEKGGMAFSSDDGKSLSRLKNLIEFALENGIYIENQSSFRKICQKYVRISILQQHDRKKISLDKIELYACIKYHSFDELRHQFETNQKQSKGRPFDLDSTLLNWLVDDALKNCVNHFIHEYRSIFYAHFDGYIENILYLLAHNELPKDIITKIWENVNNLVDKASNTLTIFSAINRFTAIQWNLYKKSFDAKQIIALLENLLKKFIFKKMNVHEERALSWNSLCNLYACGHYLQSKFTNKAIILQVIQIIDNFPQNEKITFIQNVLLELYQISDKKCQKEIKQYTTKRAFVEPDQFDSLLLFVNYHLHLTALGLEKDKNETRQMVENILQKYPSNVFYNSIQTTLSLLEFLQNKDSSFSSIYKKVQQKVNSLNKEFRHN